MMSARRTCIAFDAIHLTDETKGPTGIEPVSELVFFPIGVREKGLLLFRLSYGPFEIFFGPFGPGASD